MSKNKNQWDESCYEFETIWMVLCSHVCCDGSMFHQLLRFKVKNHSKCILTSPNILYKRACFLSIVSFSLSSENCLNILCPFRWYAQHLSNLKHLGSPIGYRFIGDSIEQFGSGKVIWMTSMIFSENSCKDTFEFICPIFYGR